MIRSLFVALLILTVGAAAPELNDHTYIRWRDHIRPSSEDLSWQSIPWRSTFWDAVIAAQQQEKPILVWAMNGHPLACT